MASSPGQEDGQRRLQQMAAEWGVETLPKPALLSRPFQLGLPSTVRTPADDHMAEELLKRQRQTNQANSQGSQGVGGLKRAFTTRKKGWEPKEVFDALDAHVTNLGSPGVAEALIAKLVTVGGDVNVAASRSRTNLLTRRKNLETFERGRILHKAIENGQVDMVAVLVPHADHVSLDSSLPAAIRSGSGDMAELLVRYGANASHTSEGQDAFRQMCCLGGHADLVELILASDGRPSPGCVSEAMVDAARKCCLDTVLRLSRSTADGNYNGAAALREAIGKCRVDVALAILTGAKPPAGAALNNAFAALFNHPNIVPNDKMAMADVLLCAGVEGDVVAAALAQAAQTGFSEMVGLLVSYGASVEYRDASVLRNAIARGKISLAQQLLAGPSVLSPIYATECLQYIPAEIKPDERHALLSLLLRKGAAGAALNECLVAATKAGDVESVRLLVTPRFPGGRLVEAHDLKIGPRGMVYDRHETASVQYQGGLAVHLAVQMANLAVLEVLLSAQPSADTLGTIFPSVNGLSPVDRYKMAERLLSTGLTGPCVHEALQRALEEHPPRRDETYIALLLRHNADPNFNGGSSIVTAVARQDVALLGSLLQKRPAPQSAAAAVPTAMAIADPTVRTDLMYLLLNAGAGLEGMEVARALVSVLKTHPTDVQLLAMLLCQGNADVNFATGTPVVLG